MLKFCTRLGAVPVDVRAGSVCLAAPRFKPGRAHCPDAASGRPYQWKSSQARLFHGNDEVGFRPRCVDGVRYFEAGIGGAQRRVVQSFYGGKIDVKRKASRPCSRTGAKNTMPGRFVAGSNAVKSGHKTAPIQSAKGATTEPRSERRTQGSPACRRSRARV